MFKKHLSKFALVVTLLYTAYLNILVVRTGFDVLMMEFLVIVVVFWRTRRGEFIKYWLPFVSMFVVYEYLRGISDNVAPFGKSTYYLVYHLERAIFPVLPTDLLSGLLKISVIKTILFLAYTSFFYYSFLVGFIVWVKGRQLFLRYAGNFLLMSYIGLLIFFLIPTAPPWYVSEHLEDMGYERTVLDRKVLPNLVGFSLYWYFVEGNEVAALPSLHVAWVAYSTLFILYNWKKSVPYRLLLIIPISVAMSVIVNAEHWLVDVIAGYFLALVFARHDVFSGLRKRIRGFTFILHKFLFPVVGAR